VALRPSAEADLTPDLAANTLTVRLRHLTQAAHDQAIEQMLADAGLLVS
jgi:hypothetical protein